MLAPVTDKTEIRKAYHLLAKRLKTGAQKVVRLIGWQGGCDEFPVYWHPREEMWTALDTEYAGTRYWCPYGTANPNETDNLPITCEINPPYSGYDRRCAGVFARDENGHICLAHSGKIGGGRKGIGKSALMSFLRGANILPVGWPDGVESDVIVISPLSDKRLVARIASFVHEVERFKTAVASGKPPIPRYYTAASFQPEFSGRRAPYSGKALVESSCYHGDVVNALAEELEGRGYKLGNDRKRDLFVASRSGNMQILFEVKTNLTASSIYGAVGQLMIHGATQKQPPRRVLVVPGTPNVKTRAALKRAGLEVLTYAWTKRGPAFKKLANVL